MTTQRISAEELKQWPKPFSLPFGNYLIEGNIPSGVDVTVDGNLEVKGSVADNVTINAAGTVTVHGNLGKKVKIEAAEICVEYVGHDCDLTATKFDITARGLYSRTTLNAQRNVRFVDGDHGIHITAGGTLDFDRIGREAILKASTICCNEVGEDSTVISTVGEMEIYNVGDRTKIFRAAEFINNGRKGKDVVIGKYRGFTERYGPALDGDVGCGIRYDPAHKRYLIPCSLKGSPLHKDFDALKGVLRDLLKNDGIYEMPEHMVADENGELQKMYLVDAGRSHQTEQIIRDTIQFYIDKHKPRGK